MNVVVVKSNYQKAGGAETLLASFLKGADARRFQTTVVALTHDLDRPLPFLHPAEFGNNPEKWVAIPWTGINSLPNAVKVARNLIRKINADVIYTHDMRANLLAYGLTRFVKIPWAPHVHGWLGKTAAGKTRFYEWVDRRLIAGADRVIVGSEALLEKIQRNPGVKNVRLIPNSIDVSRFKGSDGWDDSLRETLFPGFRGVVIGTVGRLHRGKGLHILLTAFARIHQKRRDIRCVILGEGPEEMALKRLARDLGVENSVVFAGYVEDMTPYLHLTDIFTLCSFAESLPLALLEALCLKKPAVATDVGDVGRVLSFGKESLLVKPGDVDALCAALERLIENPRLRDEYGCLGKKTVEARYSMDTAVKKIEEVLAEVGCGAA